MAGHGWPVTAETAIRALTRTSGHYSGTRRQENGWHNIFQIDFVEKTVLPTNRRIHHHTDPDADSDKFKESDRPEPLKRPS